ncbi:universal stress protein [Bacillus coahuilensis p1.1.43]|uniref:Universal stress protein n=1 Tax=Bacillus coahuilensis p1.1.43 TaxID=1150625 RepID=A0A147KAS5_9BACI|nr:universal stress protein [Bacillus coahuilensis]KUP07864.1 universal stress protein [Bacillus coahuilensis p1.1.43]
MFNKILLASDGSEHAIEAARKAGELAQKGNRPLVTIVYVVDIETSKSDVISSHSLTEVHMIRNQRMKETQEVLEKMDVLSEIIVLKGNPGAEIVKKANKEEYEVVVIGSRGLNALQEMVLGSVSHRVAKGANCPVLIVK